MLAIAYSDEAGKPSTRDVRPLGLWFWGDRWLFVGWCLLRVVTLGRYPLERFGGVDDADTRTAFFVEIVGLVVLALGIWWLAGEWP